VGKYGTAEVATDDNIKQHMRLHKAPNSLSEYVMITGFLLQKGYEIAPQSYMYITLLVCFLHCPFVYFVFNLFCDHHLCRNGD
jgi:hypothetical protein